MRSLYKGGRGGVGLRHRRCIFIKPVVKSCIQVQIIVFLEAFVLHDTKFTSMWLKKSLKPYKSLNLLLDVFSINFVVLCLCATFLCFYPHQMLKLLFSTLILKFSLSIKWIKTSYMFLSFLRCFPKEASYSSFVSKPSIRARVLMWRWKFCHFLSKEARKGYMAWLP